jgi:hypothetical protein
MYMIAEAEFQLHWLNQYSYLTNQNSKVMQREKVL